MKNYENRLSIKDASEILDISQQFIRVGLQQQRLPFGTAVQLSSEWTYHISQKLLEEYIGKSVVEKFIKEKKGGVEE